MGFVGIDRQTCVVVTTSGVMQGIMRQYRVSRRGSEQLDSHELGMCFFRCMGIKLPMMSAGLLARQLVSGEGSAATAADINPYVRGVWLWPGGTDMS